MLASIHDPRYQLLQAQLIQLRKAAGLTQMELSKLLGVGQSYISKIERGEAYVDVLLFADWCKACQATPSRVLKKLTLD